jgi:hypothetical protein
VRGAVVRGAAALASLGPNLHKIPGASDPCSQSAFSPAIQST